MNRGDFNRIGNRNDALLVTLFFLVFSISGMSLLYAQEEKVKSPSMAELAARADSISELAGDIGLVADKRMVNLMEHLIRRAPEFQTFVKAINNADLVELLSDSNRLTVFAPTNVAFSNLKGGNIEELLLPENLPALQNLVTTHIIAGYWPLDSIRSEVERRGGALLLPSIGEGGDIRFSLEADRLLLTDPLGNRIYLEAPSPCTNGWLYKIETVLQPGVKE